MSPQARTKASGRSWRIFFKWGGYLIAVLLIVDTLELVVVLTLFVAIGVRERWAIELRGARIVAMTINAIKAEMGDVPIL